MSAAREMWGASQRAREGTAAGEQSPAAGPVLAFKMRYWRAPAVGAAPQPPAPDLAVRGHGGGKSPQNL
jgi:hypothetical protein